MIYDNLEEYEQEGKRMDVDDNFINQYSKEEDKK